MKIWITALCLVAAVPSRADQKADALIEKARQAALAGNSLEAVAAMRGGPESAPGAMTMRAVVQVLRPNFCRMQITGMQTGDLTIVSDGKTLFMVMDKARQYRTMPAPPKGLGPGSSLTGDPVSAFLNPDEIGAKGKRFYGGPKTIEGKAYETVKLVMPDSESVLYFDGTGLMVRSEFSQSIPNGPKMNILNVLSDIKQNTELRPEHFAYTPPKDFTLYSPTARYDTSLIAEGKAAPDFTIPVPRGGTITLSKAAAANKATIVNFWFYG